MSRRFVVEADGGSRGNPGPAAYGALVRDAGAGDVLVEVAEAIGVASNNVAEYGGLIAGLRAAVELDPDCTIEVRMDSKLVVEQMSGRWKIRHEDMRRLALEAREAADPARVRYTWVPRERNKAADRLANEAMDDAARGLPWRGMARDTARDTERETGRDRAPETRDAPQGAAASAARPGPEDAACTLVMLRHGVTVHTPQRRFSGAGGDDPALSDLGVAQVQAAAAGLLAAEAFDAVISSPMRRAVQTAQVVAERLGLPVVVEDAWIEGSFGRWDGLTSAEVMQQWPQEFEAWLASTGQAPPGGESFDVVATRVREARRRLVAAHGGGRVLVVGHGGPIKAVVLESLGVGAEAVWRLESSPASLTTTMWWPDGGSALVSYNETAHLRAAGVALR